jgi:hypothetical protein
MNNLWMYLIGAGLVVVVLFGFLQKKEVIVIKPETPEVPVDDKDIKAGSYSVMYKTWSWSGCPETQFERGTYWVNKDDGRTFYLGDAVQKPIVAFGIFPHSYIKEVLSRPPKAVCVPCEE